MIRPQRRSSMPSMTCLVVLNRPLRLVSITARQFSRDSLRKVASRVMPALFTSTSIGPTFACTSSKLLCVLSQSPMSQSTQWKW